jgi:hypothetical protein
MPLSPTVASADNVQYSSIYGLSRNLMRERIAISLRSSPSMGSTRLSNCKAEDIVSAACVHECMLVLMVRCLHVGRFHNFNQANNTLYPCN